jgi:hypothetical protein
MLFCVCLATYVIVFFMIIVFRQSTDWFNQFVLEGVRYILVV